MKEFFKEYRDEVHLKSNKNGISYFRLVFEISMMDSIQIEGDKKNTSFSESVCIFACFYKGNKVGKSNFVGYISPDRLIENIKWNDMNEEKEKNDNCTRNYLSPNNDEVINSNLLKVFKFFDEVFEYKKKMLKIRVENKKNIVCIMDSLDGFILQNYDSGYCSVDIEVDGNNSRGFAFEPLYSLYDLNFVIKKAIEDAVIKSSTVIPESGYYNVLIENSVMKQLLAHIAPCFYLNKINIGISFVNYVNDDTIGNECLTIIDNPFVRFNRRYYDEEGSRTCYIKVVYKGKWLSALNNIEYAKKTDVDVLEMDSMPIIMTIPTLWQQICIYKKGNTLELDYRIF